MLIDLKKSHYQETSFNIFVFLSLVVAVLSIFMHGLVAKYMYFIYWLIFPMYIYMAVFIIKKYHLSSSIELTLLVLNFLWLIISRWLLREDNFGVNSATFWGLLW